MFKLGIVGSRSITDYELVEEILDSIKCLYLEDIFVISGGAKGIDSLAIKWAIENNISYEEIVPQWGLHGKAAGFVRNTEIAQKCDKLVAIWDGQSKGTMDTVSKTKLLKKQVYLVNLKTKGV